MGGGHLFPVYATENTSFSPCAFVYYHESPLKLNLWNFFGKYVPIATRAGVASGAIQNDTHEIVTNSMPGM